MNREAVFGIFLATIALSTASISPMRICSEEHQNVCTVNELRITPCPRLPCALTRGRESIVEFDYTPHFGASKLKTAMYWGLYPASEDYYPSKMQFWEFSITDACPHTACPVVSGTNGTFSYTQLISKIPPTGRFWFRWKVWNEDNIADVCCVETLVSIRLNPPVGTSPGLLSASHTSSPPSESDAAMNKASIALSTASISPTRICSEEPQNACTVNELRITPCPRLPCAFRRGRESSVEFDYTPHFDASKLKTAVYWPDYALMMPFGRIGITDACPHTACPVVSGTNGTFTYTHYITKKLPARLFWFRWKVWNEDNIADVCCVETLVSIR